MSWGGPRPGSGRKRLPDDKLKWKRKKLPASARKPLGAGTAQPTFTTTPSNPPADDPKAPRRGIQNYEAIAELLERAKARRSGVENPKLSPFKLPVFPKAALPAKKHQMALDAAIDWAATQWDGNYINDVAAEGMMFLGYTYLAELAQRPEYRTAIDTIATEATRKWIKFSTIDDEKTKDEKSGKDKDGAKAKKQPGDKSDPAQAQDRAPQEEDDTITAPGEVPDEPDDEDEKTKQLAAKKANEKNKKIKELVDFMDHLQVRDRFAELSAQDGYFGRTHLYLDSGEEIGSDELKTPIADLNNNKVIKGKIGKGWLKRLQVIEPVWVYPTTYNATNPLAPDWYNPQIWYVMGQEIHCSRLLTFMSRPVPDLLKPSYAFGGLSLSQIMKPYVDIWLTTRQSIGQLIHAFSVMVLKTDLATILQAGASTADLLLRAEIFNALRDSQGLMILNKESEEFENVSTPLSGLSDLQSQAQEHMLSVTRIPAIKAFGIQPEGLNASSEGEMRAFNDTIKAYQLYFMKPRLDLLIDICMLTLWGKIDRDITYEFESLVELTEKEKGEKRKHDAETGDILIQAGVISPAEERKRVIAEPDSQYHGLDPDDVPEPPPDPMDDGGDDPFGGGGGDDPRKPAPKPPGGADGDPFAFDASLEARVTVPLLIRLMEFAREDAKGDEELHVIAEKIIEHGPDVIGMKDYNDLLPKSDLAGDVSVSKAQHNAMEAAAHGHSTLGIPESVGKEFAEADKGKSFDTAFDDFNEADHPRGQPGNAGQFGPGGGSHALKSKDPGTGSGQGEKSPPGASGGEPDAGKAAEIPKAPKAVATELYRQHSNPNVTPADVMAKLPPAAAEAMARVNAEIAAATPTDAPVSKGGFVQDDGTFTPERQEIHYKIVEHFLSPENIARATPPEGTEPTITMLGGRGGSGKSWLTATDKGGPIDASKSLLLDADEIKSMLPGYKPHLAALYHEESSYLLKILGDEVRSRRLNVIYDATMQKESSILPRLQSHLADGYKVEAFYMFVPPEVAAERAAHRFYKNGNANGRYVPPQVVLGNKTNEDVFDRVKEHATKWGLYSNMGKAPQFVAGSHDEQKQQG